MGEIPLLLQVFNPCHASSLVFHRHYLQPPHSRSRKSPYHVSCSLVLISSHRNILDSSTRASSGILSAFYHNTSSAMQIKFLISFSVRLCVHKCTMRISSARRSSSLLPWPSASPAAGACPLPWPRRIEAPAMALRFLCDVLLPLIFLLAGSNIQSRPGILPEAMRARSISLLQRCARLQPALLLFLSARRPSSAR
jgi:hypothetical protein